MEITIDEGVELLKKEEVIAYPTETVYGMGANIYSIRAINKIFDLKKRQIDKPISIAISDFYMMEDFAFLPNRDVVRVLLSRPITVILKKKRSVPDILTGRTGKIGMRLPEHPVAQDIIKKFGSPITSTSANISGEEPPKCVEDIPFDIPVINGGEVSGVPSTVVDLVDKKIIRNGMDDEFAKRVLKDFGVIR
ncbi:MAG: Threonylcarbamoyl-AMP synthase [Candidatus Methanolliviera sp. GoM_asphalt]|nr:MAG: Threonylcarbamoyl-AMP synthase [Candidatus Methanolliviera sp. GoM_asphalt]